MRKLGTAHARRGPQVTCVYSQADWQEGGRHLHVNFVGIFNTSEFPQFSLYDQVKCAHCDSEINLVTCVTIFPL